MILAQQNPATGMWGASDLPLHEQISGTLSASPPMPTALTLTTAAGLPSRHSCDRCTQSRARGAIQTGSCPPWVAGVLGV
jgi:hypothetical protein